MAIIISLVIGAIGGAVVALLMVEIGLEEISYMHCDECRHCFEAKMEDVE